MPNLINILEEKMDLLQQQQWLFEAKLNYSLLEIMEKLEVNDQDEINLSLSRAFKACEKLQLALRLNFKKVYCFDGNKLITDWKISALACYLLVINCNPYNERVAKAQLYFAFQKVNQPN